MTKQTVKFARLRLVKFYGIRVYSYEGQKPVHRAGVYGKGK